MASGARDTQTSAGTGRGEPAEAGDGRGETGRAGEESRLEVLHRLSALLTRFESVKRDVSAVLALLGEHLPLRTAVLILDGAEPHRVSLWHVQGASAAQREAALAHARRAYAQLGEEGDLVEAEAGPPSVLRGPAAPGSSEPGLGSVMLPLVVAGGPIFGALQLEAIAPLDELDLKLVNTVVNQLAIAIDRHRAIEAHRQAAELRRVEAERGRARAEALQRRYEALVDNLHSAFVWEASAPDRDLTYISARAVDLLGFREWRGGQLLERVHEDDREAVERTLAAVLAGGADRSLEHRMVAADGRVRWFHTGVHLAGDAARCWQGVSIDVTAAHEATALVAAQLDFTRAVTASIGEAVLAVDRELRVTSLNPTAEAMLGVTSRASGQPVEDMLEITRAEDGARVSGSANPLARVIRSGARLRSDAACFAGPGAAPIPVSFTAAPIRMGGEVTGAVLVFRDLLEVRRAEREQRFLAETSALLSSSLEVRATLSRLARAAVPALADVCVVDALDDEGRVARLEIAFADPAKQPLAERLRAFAPVPGSATPQGRALREGQAILLPDTARASIARDEEHRRLLEEIGLCSLIVVPLIARDRILGALTFGAIGAKRRYGERELAFAEDVARRAALAVDNARLYEQARRATEARQELLAVVSHDLRNPLSAVLMATQILLEEPSAPADVRVTVGRIRRAADRANRLVEDLLDIGAIESGRFTVQLSTHALGPLLEEALEASRAAADEAALRLELEPPPPMEVRCDRGRILQVLGNLVGNAIKFTPRGGRVTVRAARRAREAVVSVRDTGPGMPEESLPRVFDRYWQAAHAGRGGAGLGLAIAQGLVRAHGGSIWVESRVGAGSTFSFTLPLADGAAPPRAPR